jgi:hypothetical protein
MPIVVMVHVDAEHERVARVERENPELMEQIIAAAEGRMKGHRRLFREGQVIDIDEFDTVADYEAFVAEAQGAIARLGEAVGVAYRDVVFSVDEVDSDA